MFAELPPAMTGIVTENRYADPAMWGERFQEYFLGSIGSGVAIGDYDERYVIPKRHGEASPDAFAEQGSCGIDFSGVTATVVPGAANDNGLENYGDAHLADDFDLREQLVHRKGKGNGDG